MNNLYAKYLENCNNIDAYYQNLVTLTKNHFYVGSTNEWILDNYYLVVEHKNVIKKRIKEDKKIKYLLETNSNMYNILLDIFEKNKFNIDISTLIRELNAYQNKNDYYYSYGTIRIAPILMTMIITDKLNELCTFKNKKQQDVYKVNNLINKIESDIEAGKEVDLKEYVSIDDYILTHPTYLYHLNSNLKEFGEKSTDVFESLNKYLEEHHIDLKEVINKEHIQSIEDNLLISNLFNNLRTVSKIEINYLYDKISKSESLLLKDDTYSKMTKESKDLYRHQIELNTKHKDEYKYVEDIVKKSEKSKKELSDYLFKNKNYKLTFRLYFCLLIVFTILISWLLCPFLLDNHIISFILLLVPVSEVVKELLNKIFMMFNRPHTLPKLDFSKGIPKEDATMVVIPTIVKDTKKIDDMFEALEKYYLSNKTNNLFFTLLGDCKESDSKEIDVDKLIAGYGVDKAKELNNKYGKDLFYFIYRRRSYNDKEGKFLGYERKRGGLLHFNKILLGKLTKEEKDKYIYVETVSSLKTKIKYVITLDTDTELVLNTAQQLVGLMAHPYNKPVLNKNKTKVISGYALVQPKVSLDIESTNKSVYSQLIAGIGGFDIYSSIVPNFYQDVFGEGSFVGKGIYDVEVFETVLGDKLPENLILSHDLLEGNYVRCGYASDVELIDDFPGEFLVDMSRQHRWARGDVQILGWLFGKVKNKRGEKVKNPLNGIEKFKIFDNLRRMLLDQSLVLLIMLSFFFGDSFNTLITTVLIISLPIFFYLKEIFNIRRRTVSSFNHYDSLVFGAKALVSRLFINFISIPYVAYMHLNAACKSLYRMFISHKNLLNWITAEDAAKSIDKKLKTYLMNFKPNYIVVIVLIIGIIYRPENIFVGLLIIVSFLLAPYLLWSVSQKEESDDVLDEASDKDLLEVARRTWKYFDTLLKEENHYLIPDNYQVNREIKEDSKTSPTDIGMSITSVIAACDLEFITKEKAHDLLTGIVGAIESLEKWNGLIYNWYNIKTMKKMIPYDISSVDNGNLAACLLVGKNFAKKYKYRELETRFEDLFINMNFKPLYTSKDVFSISYMSGEDKLSVYNYNKFASESRILSFVAIAKGDAPSKHWLCLDKSLTKYKKYKGLASWSGTSFEYFMPEIFMKSYSNTLLDESYFFSVMCQKEYMKEVNPKMPWGISESAYGELDDGLNYKYRAFSTPYLKVQEDKVQRVVISPYSSLLAITNYPTEVYRNVKKLKDLGLYSDFGFYEAYDYDEKEIVLSYFAHHQGMILASLSNYLCNENIRNYFHNDVRIKAVEILLKEKVQLNPVIDLKIYGYKKYNYEREIVENDIRELNHLSSIPEVSVLSNSNYLLLINDRGNGFSRYKKTQLNRYRKITEQDYGNFVYIKDLASGAYWSNTYAPVNIKPERYSIVFASDRITFLRLDNEVLTKTEMIVTKEHDAEIRKITFKNHSDEDKYLEVTTYTEPIIIENIEDITHRTFKSLFISSKFDKDKEALIMCRKNNSKKTRDYMVTKLLVEGDHSMQFETERANFIGRNRNTDRPLALTKKNLSNKEGTTIDPVMSLRTNIVVPAKKEKTVYYITGFSKSRDQIDTILDAYNSSSKISTAFKYATLANNINTKTLNITGPDMRNYNIMLDYLYQTSRHFINPERKDILTKNALNQSTLWKFGISGDLPIILVELHDAAYLNLVKEVLKAYEFYKSRSIFIDVVIINREKDEYKKNITREIEKEKYRMHSIHSYMDTPGEIYVLDDKTVSPEESILFNMVARLRFDTRRSSSLSESIKILQKENEMIDYDKPVFVESLESEKEDEELDFYNEFGGFTKDKKEYVITNRDTPVPWTNIIANDRFGTLVTNNECGFTYAYNSQMFKVTSWTNDIVLDDKSEVIKVNDKIVNATSVRHGFGYSVFNHNTSDYSFETTHFVSAEDTVKFFKIKFKNKKKSKETYKLTFSINPTFGPNEEKSSRYLLTDYFEKMNSVLIRNVYNMNFNHITCFMSSTLPVTEYQINKILFKSITVDLDINGEEEKELSFMLGTEIGNDKVKELHDKYNTDESINKELDKVKKYWDKKLGTIKVKTPDESFNTVLNGWYLYQTMASRLKAKAGFYQVGGAFGFRDQLQDATNIVMVDEEKTKSQIIENARHQFLQGDVLHWWHEIISMGLRSRFKDDYLWLVYSVNKYIKESGDIKFADEQVPFINGQMLDEGEAERGIIYTYTKEKASIFEHCVIALEKSMKELGDNGLPLMGGGDWNDGMNRVGIEGKGTSVWLGFFLYYVMTEFIDIFKDRKDLAKDKYEKFLKKLKDNLNNNAWDKDYYLRAFFDNGTKLGSVESEECKIDLLSQSFAILSDVIPEERIPSVIKSVEDTLVDNNLNIIKLLTPGFEKSKNNPGYIMDYPVGIRENGGQYTHSVSWYIMALIKIGQVDLAYKYYQMINPINRSLDKKAVKTYKVEPYVISADIYSSKDHPARGGWTWYTGSAGWFYKVGIEEFLGIIKHGNTLRFDPHVPKDWKSFEIEYRYFDATYKIKINFSNTDSIVVDGDISNKDYITLNKAKRVHAVVVNIRRK